MADNIILDAFAGYDTSTAEIFWNILAPTISAIAGRSGRPGATKQAERSFSVLHTAAAGMAMKLESFNTGSLFGFNDRFGYGAQVRLVPTGDGRLFVTYGTTRTTDWVSGPPSDVVMALGSWFYYELRVTITNVGLPVPTHSVCDYIVRVNEEQVLAGSITSSPVTEEGVASLIVELNSTPGSGAYCDLYVTDGEFLGDIKNYIIKPDGDSAPSQWVPSTPGAHYLMVNDAAPDGASSVLSSENAGDQDMVTLEDISPTVGLIRGIQANFVAQKTDAGLSSFRSEYNISGAPYEHPDDKFLSFQSFLNFPDCFRKNPITGNDFTVDEINSMIMGVKRTA